MQAFLHMAGGIALLLWGAYMVKTGILRTFGVALRAFLAKHLSNRFIALGSGTFLASLLQSATAATLIVASVQSEGLITTAIGFACILGADFGSALMSRILSFDLSFVSPLVILVGAILFFNRHGDSRSGQFGRLLIGLGIMILALRLIIASTMPLRTSPDIMPIFEQIAQMPAMAVLLGIALGLGCFSSLAAVIITTGLVTSGVIPVSTGLWVVLGADIENTILGLMTTLTVSRAGRRAPIANTIWRSTMLFITGVVLATVPAVHTFFEGIPDAPIYFHVGLNLAFSIIGIFFVGIVAKIAERILPVENDKIRRKDAAGLFSKENLIGGGMSLYLASTELGKITGEVDNCWKDMDKILRKNPSQGQILVMHDLVAHITERCNTVSRYLGLVMRGPMTHEDAVEWQYLKNVNASLKLALSVVDRIITITAENKCARNLAFTPTGLAELQMLHRRAEACIYKLGTIITSNNPHERRNVCQMLLNEREIMLKSSFELTQHHMQRVADGQTGAIETSALHLELQTLFTRFASIICTAVNMEALTVPLHPGADE
ncbi:MAG: Na/Pi symporter [Duodenibacillus sp.]|nr:Na/Pi symporter [Duodenibacillus sp.]